MEGSHPPFLRNVSHFKLLLWTKLLDHNFWTKLLLLDKTPHWLQEFGIGRPPTHRVVFRSFPLFVCQQFQNKQTNTLRSCLLLSTLPCTVLLVAPDWHKLLFCLCYLCSKFDPQCVLNSISSLWKLLENCSQTLSTAHPSRDRKTLCPRTILSGGSTRFTNCKSINPTYWMRLTILGEKGGWNRKVCKKERILDNIHCVGGGGASTSWYLSFVSCLAAWTCPSMIRADPWFGRKCSWMRESKH